MNKTSTRQFDPNVLAILHRTGRVWRGVIAGYSPRNGGKARLAAHREFTAAETSRLAAWIDEHNAGQILVVLHASTVICRTCQLPDAPQDQLGPALRLQAEAHLFGIAPPHRMGMAVLEPAPGETSRAGIVLAWPEHRPESGERADAHRPPISDEQLAGRTVRYTPDVASLAALLNGHRPTQPLAWVDREDGSLALAVTHANGAVFRGLREDAADVQAWKTSVGRVLAETCLSVGHTGAFIESLVTNMHERLADLGEGDSRLIAPAEVIEGAKARIENAPGDDRWWSQYGIAAGAALARASDLAPLTELRESVQVQVASPLDRAVAALSSRRAAVAAVLACVAVLLFGSLAFNGARVAILRAKYPDSVLREQLAEVRTAGNQLVMYRELDRNSWSMTKVLSDIVSNMPQGIELEHVRVTPTRTFNVQGRVIPHGGRTATELVAVMRQDLDDTGIFRDFALQWRDPDAFGHYQFSLSANISRPFHQFAYPEDRDFALKPLAERLYGARAAQPTQTAAAERPAERPADDVEAVTGMVAEAIRSGVLTDEPDPDFDAAMASGEMYGEEYSEEMGYETGEDAGRVTTRPAVDRSGITRTRDFDGRPSASRIVDRGDGPVSSPDDIPAPMTRDQIQAMSDAEVLNMLGRVAQARQRAQARGDTELVERLRQEFDWLMERRRSPR